MNNAITRIEAAFADFNDVTKHPVPAGRSQIREAWRLTAAFCRRHDIQTLRTDHDGRFGADKWRPVTSRDIANRHMTEFRVVSK